MIRKRTVFALVLVIALVALTGGAEAAHWITGTVNDAVDSTPADGHTAIIYYLGDEANYASDVIGPAGGSGTANKYLCDAEAIPGHVWKVGDELYVMVIDTGDGYTAGPVSLVTTGAGFDTAPDMTLQAPPAAPVVVINEVVADNTTEWVELYNKGADAVDLTGWTLEDEVGNTKSLTSLGTIAVGDYAVYTVASGWLNNGGDVIFLKNDSGGIIDQVGYGTSGDAPAPDAGKSTGRCPNGVDADDDALDFTEMDTPTPDAENVCPIDTTAPTTAVTAPELPGEPSPIPTEHQLDWTNSSVMLSFLRTDASGVAYTNFSTTSGEGAWTTVNETAVNGPDAGLVSDITDQTFKVTVAAEGETTIWYYSVDLNETPNTEAVKNMTVKIDLTDPVIESVVLDPTTPAPNGDILVTVNVTDALSDIAMVTANGVQLTKQNSPWNGTITAEFLPGTHNVTVNATDNAGNIVTDDTAQYTVPVVYGVDLTPDKTAETIVEGGTATYTITVENTGNVADMINLTKDGIGTLNNMSVNLAVGASEAVTLTVTSNTLGDHVTTVNATSQGDVNKTASVTVTTTVVAKQYGVTLTPDKTTETIVEGQTATYTLTVENTGNVEDIINLTADGVGTLSKTAVTLGAGVSEAVTLTVQGGTTGTFATTINATSQGDVNKTASVTVTTTVNKKYVSRGGGGYTQLDSDGDGYSDIVETLQNSSLIDPCDPDPTCAACLATKPAATPATPTAKPTAAPTAPPPTTKPTAKPTAATPTPTPEEPGFGAVFAITGLLAVAYLVLRRKQG